MEAKDFLEKYGINTDEIIYSSDDEAHRLVDLMNGFVKELSELKKLRVTLKKYNNKFVEGVNIISKYIPEDSDFDYSFYQDQMWFGDFESVTDQKDIDRLIELGWVYDDDLWSICN